MAVNSTEGFLVRRDRKIKCGRQGLYKWGRWDHSDGAHRGVLGPEVEQPIFSEVLFAG